MLTFSSIYDWQGNPAVQQILVFSSQEMKELFEHEMLDRLNKATDGYAGVDLAEYRIKIKNELSDSNAGAIYKLRAVKCNDNTWNAVIRCGFTGGLLWEDIKYCNSNAALRNCIAHLRNKLNVDLDTILNKNLVTE